ncbi:MAG: winged helix-turn-helix transcriptional regulator [Chloroflexi bacterium]|nr:winged helix-turn-helix transcriptional regulator [Chloroflexota bacterium]
MIADLLTTKFFPPPLRAQLVPRQRLVDRLLTGLQQRCGLALISAPAGFGKTTVVVEALQQAGFRAAWVSLDGLDNDLIRFWRYFITALHRIDSEIGGLALDMLNAGHETRPPIDAILTSLINDLAGQNTPMLVVLDDYHAIELPEIHESLNFLLDHLPQCFHIVLTTRADPPLSLARRRGRLEIVEIRAADLRFTTGEAAEFINDTMRLGLRQADLEQLVRRTEGWAAGLQMAALALERIGSEPDEQVQHRRGEFIASFAGDDQYIGDFLVEEVLQRQPAGVQEFLLRTSILERMCGPLCDALLDEGGAGGGQAMLAALDRANLFVVPLDNRQEWYRYHRLFGELLQRRLRQWHGEQVEVELHARASRWFEENALYHEAFDHALRANDPQRAAALAQEAAPILFQSSQLKDVLEWISRLPEEIVLSMPQLMMHWSWAALATGRFDESVRALDEIQKRTGLSLDLLRAEPQVLDSFEPGLVMFLSMIAAERATIAAGGLDVPGGMTIARNLIDFLNHYGDQGPYQPAYSQITVAHFCLGIGYENLGDTERASQWLTETVACCRRWGNHYILPMAISRLALLQTVRGQLREAVETYREALKISGDLTGHPSPFVSLAHSGLGLVLYEWDDLEGACRELERSIELAYPWNHWEALVPSSVVLAQARLAMGDPLGALALLDDLDNAWQRMYRSGPLPAVQRWRVLVTGDLDQAARLVKSLETPLEELHVARIFYSKDQQQLLNVRLFMMLEQFDEALLLLDQLLGDDEISGRAATQIQGLVLKSAILYRQGQSAQARLCLEQALRLGEHGGYVRVFLDEGEPIAQILSGILRDENSAEDLRPYAARLVSAFPESVFACDFAPKPPSAVAPDFAAPLLPEVEPLTDRELEILRLIAQGLTNRQIADRLYISTGTVKVHTNNIYSKLGVNSRTSAVARARLLGLLD